MGELLNKLEHVAKQQARDAGEKPGNTARPSILASLIQASHVIRGYPPLEITDAANQAAVWDSFMLHALPDEDLAPAFARGLERLEQGEAFGAIHVREGWKELKAERAEARAREQQARSLGYKAEGITFAQWWERDGAWIQANLPPATQAAMREIFEARKAKGILSGPPPAKDTYVSAPPAPDPRYCQKCSRLSGLYWDDLRAKYRCCECDGGRDMARAIWEPRSRESGKRGWSKA